MGREQQAYDNKLGRERQQADDNKLGREQQAYNNKLGNNKRGRKR